MKTYITEQIKIPIEKFDESQFSVIVSCEVYIHRDDIKNCKLHKKSIDARKKDNIFYVCTFTFDTDKIPSNAKPYALPNNIFNNIVKTEQPKRVVIVGSGPSGLFCALYLARAGHKVTILERGSDIAKRKEIVDSYKNGGEFNSNTNIQFGLGGAGTFSDGKLTTGTSSPLIHTVFSEFVRFGATEDIMYNSLPHIGTDKLEKIVANMRDEIVKLGGKIYFDTLFTDIYTVSNKIAGVKCILQNIECTILCDEVVLAIGHSARDTVKQLDKSGIQIVNKPFAIGVRVEHEREFISTSQYGQLAKTHRDFVSASYKLVAKTDCRSCYTFCMCPGGEVVPANSTENSVVTNGMSNYLRDDKNSNSALVVNVTEDDFGSELFDGIVFQEKIEHQCFVSAGSNFKAPCQNVTDFLSHKKSKKLDITPSYSRGVTSVNLWNVLPEYVCRSIELGLIQFGKKIKGFDKCGVLIAPETRTSSPIRILRDKESLQSNIQNLYPCGEGAGYSGGIVSSAVDGLKVALKICEK